MMAPDETKLKAMYQAVVMRHFKSPVLRDVPSDAAHFTLNNPLCGDEVTVHGWSENNVTQCALHAKGCALCVASASILTQSMQREGVEHVVLALAPQLKQALQPHAVSSDAFAPSDPDLLALLGARFFPVRLKCVRLPWEAMLQFASMGSLPHRS